jgi:hypothetical protein
MMDAGQNRWATTYTGVLLAIAILGLIIGYAIID